VIYDKFNLPTIADDSGIVALQLGNEPGVYSARYAGENATDEENNIKLLERLNSFPKPHKAKFVCAAVYYFSGDFKIVMGEINGQIIKEPRGTNGFGYDPLFLPDGYDKTSAELTPEIKNKISHRYRAFNKLKVYL
jgi:XTP/dITP diphosphohydrolase